MRDNFTITEHGREQRTQSHIRQQDKERRFSILTFLLQKPGFKSNLSCLSHQPIAVLFSPRWKNIFVSWKLMFNPFLAVFSNVSLFKNQH